MNKFLKYAAPPLILIFILCLFSGVFSAGKVLITISNITSPRSLQQILNSFDIEVDSLINQARTNDYVFNDPNITVYNSTSTHKLQTDALYFIVNGCLYTKATGSVTLSGNGVPLGKYGAWALDVGTNGTIDVTPASANATGYTTAALAVAGLPAKASDHARLGYMTATKSNGIFYPGITQIAASGITAAYTDLTAASNISADLIDRGK